MCCLELNPMQVEISLQPWRAFKPDGVILFSDILTPLTGMGIPFDIEAGRGPVIHTPIRTMQVRNSLVSHFHSFVPMDHSRWLVYAHLSLLQTVWNNADLVVTL